MADHPVPPLRVQSQYNSDVDPRLIAIIEQAAAYTPFQVELRSGFRTTDSRQHSKHHAIDVNLIDPATGKVLPNYQDGRNFREYEQFAQAARAVQMANFPELEGSFRWGGYFGGKNKKTGAFDPKGYGAFDLMHFDVNSGLPMGQGSWEHGLSSKMKRTYNVAETVGMGQNARSKDFLTTLTPGGYQPAPPNPANSSFALAARRNTTPASGTAASAAAALGGDPGAAFDPAAPVPAPRLASRTPAAVPQTMETAEQIYAPFPGIKPPGTTPKPPGLGMTDAEVADVYRGTPIKPAGTDVADVYRGFPMPPETDPAAIVPATYTPPPTGTTFAPAGKEALAIPITRKMTTEALAPPPVETLQPLSTPGLTVAQDMDAPAPATMSPALKAARDRLSAERAKRAGTRIGEAAAPTTEAPKATLPSWKVMAQPKPPGTITYVQPKPPGTPDTPAPLTPAEEIIRRQHETLAQPAPVAAFDLAAPQPADMTPERLAALRGRNAPVPATASPNLRTPKAPVETNFIEDIQAGLPSLGAQIEEAQPKPNFLTRIFEPLIRKHNTRTLERLADQLTAYVKDNPPTGGNALGRSGTAGGDALTAGRDPNPIYYSTSTGPNALSRTTADLVRANGNALSGNAMRWIMNNTNDSSSETPRFAPGGNGRVR